jgi:hypothetical protein
MGMRTLSREPWRGGQICGYQTAYGLPWSVFCGEFKKPGSPVCEEHDKEMREENGGRLPRFAEGNALGLAAYRRETMPYMFELSWEPSEGRGPIPATEEEIKSWKKA